MKIIDKNNSEIRTIREWKDYFLSNESKKGHWEIGRSAHSIADFMLNHNGDKRINEIISNLLNEDVQFISAIPEYEVRFDKFGHGREHDLGIFGETASGKSIFIGVEAKVDEPFGEKILDSYLKAKSKELNGIKTYAPQRIEDLMKLNFYKISPKLFNLRYQLLYATAGTIKEKKQSDISILLIIVFITDKYNTVKGELNFNDYKSFIKAIDFEELELDEVKSVHKININGRKLYSIYMSINMP